MLILDQVSRGEIFQPNNTFDVFLLQLAKRLQDDQQIGWYVHYAKQSIDDLLTMYSRTLSLPVQDRAAQLRSFILNPPAP